MKNNWNKYGAKKLEIDGHKFDSKKEAYRYCELKLLLKANEISELELQPKFRLQEGFNYKNERLRPVDYIADFKYKDSDGTIIVEDTKGYKTKDYIIKKKWFLKQYGNNIDFREL